MKIQQRDIFLVPFPFSNLKGNKVRPVLIISNDDFNNNSDDVIVCGITSNVLKGRYAIKISNKNLEDGYLFSISSVKVENILKIDKSLLIKKIGRIRKDILSAVLERLKGIFS